MRYLFLLSLLAAGCVSPQIPAATKTSHGLEARAEEDLYNAAVESASGIVDPMAKLTVLLAFRDRHQRYVTLHGTTAAGIDAPPILTQEQLTPLVDIVKAALKKGGP